MTSTYTFTSANGKTYEIEISHSWLNGTMTCTDTGRTYPFVADDAETIEEAVEEAIEWCEWHSTQDPRRETRTGDVWRCL